MAIRQFIAAAVAATLSVSLVACGGNPEYDRLGEAVAESIQNNTTADEWVTICENQDAFIEQFAATLADNNQDLSLSEDDWWQIVMEPVVKGCVVNGQ